MPSNQIHRRRQSSGTVTSHRPNQTPLGISKILNNIWFILVCRCNEHCHRHTNTPPPQNRSKKQTACSAKCVGPMMLSSDHHKTASGRASWLLVPLLLATALVCCCAEAAGRCPHSPVASCAVVMQVVTCRMNQQQLHPPSTHQEATSHSTTAWRITSPSEPPWLSSTPHSWPLRQQTTMQQQQQGMPGQEDIPHALNPPWQPRSTPADRLPAAAPPRATGAHNAQASVQWGQRSAAAAPASC